MRRSRIALIAVLGVLAAVYAHSVDMTSAKRKRDLFARAEVNKAMISVIAKRNPELKRHIEQLKGERDHASSPSRSKELDDKIAEATKGYDMFCARAESVIVENEQLIQQIKALPRQRIWLRDADARSADALSLEKYRNIPNQAL